MASTSSHVSRGADRSPAERVRLPILLLVAGVLLAAVAVWAPAVEQRASSERTYELTRSGQLMLTAMLDQETGVRGYLLTADRRFLEPYGRGRAAFDGAEREVLREAGGDAEISGLVAESAGIASDWQHEAADAVEHVRRHGAGTTTSTALRRKVLMDRFRASNAQLIKAVDNRRRDALARSEVMPVLAILLLAAAGIAIGWAAVVRPRRRVAKEQRLARRYAAEQREFTEALQMTGNEDEANELLERPAPQQLRQPPRGHLRPEIGRQRRRGPRGRRAARVRRDPLRPRAPPGRQHPAARPVRPVRPGRGCRRG